MKKLAVITAIALSWSRMATPAHAYTHPGIPFTGDDLATIKANINAGREPWKSGYAALQADSRSSLTYTMQGPFATVSRNSQWLNVAAWENDMTAVFDLSLMWYFTQNGAYAQKAHDILLSWAANNTTFTGDGGGAAFELGDYAYCFAGGADILRGTWPGWTAADTATVQNYFTTVYAQPNLNPSQPMLQGSQGIEQLLGALAIAVFNDDVGTFNQTLSSFYADADSGLRDTLANGQVGDTGRDQGHTSLYINNLALIGEICWKQGVDVFSALDNRILAAGEYYARYNLPGPTPPFVNFGAPFWGPFSSIGGAPRSTTQSRRALNILRGAYTVRKGLSAPWIAQYCNDQAEDAHSFLFRKSADLSTATPPTVTGPAAAASVTTGLTSANLNGCVPAGSTSYGNGTWTLNSGYNGGDPWYASTASDTVRFAYKQITGDFTILAKVTSVSNVGSAGAKAGLMMRDSLGSTVNRCTVALTPASTYERCMRGWTALPYGSNAQSLAFSVPQGPCWVKMERSGNRIQTYISINGGDWSPAGTADFANLPGSVYVGLFGASMVSNTANTATFTNVCITGGDGGAGVTTPAAPFAVLAAGSDSQVQLRWNESFGATSYTVKRSTTSGGGYATIATVSNTTYTDTAATNGTTYYYVVTASNSAGESASTPQDSATPQATTINVAFGGTATASANGSSSTGGAAQSFDTNPGTKWYNNNAGTTGWLQYDFGSGLAPTIKSYALTSANDVPQRDPKDWQFQGSNDGVNWTSLDAQSTQSFAYRYQSKTFPVATPAAYRYYRLNITANSGGTGYGIQLGELALLTDTGRTIPNGTYRLINRKSQKAMDVQNGSAADGTKVVQWGYSGANSQKWTFVDQGNGQYQILGVASGKAIDVSGASTANGAAIDIWPWNGGNNQKWTIAPTGDGYFCLKAVHSGKAADVGGGSTADGATVIQWPYGGGVNQQWSISIAP